MTPNDFVRRFLGLLPHDNYNEETVKLLANVVDTTKDGCVRRRPSLRPSLYIGGTTSKAKSKTKSQAESKAKCKAESETKSKVKSESNSEAEFKTKSKAKSRTKFKTNSKIKSEAKSAAKCKAESRTKSEPSLRPFAISVSQHLNFQFHFHYEACEYFKLHKFAIIQLLSVDT